MRGSIVQRGARSWAIIVDERDVVSASGAGDGIRTRARERAQRRNVPD